LLDVQVLPLESQRQQFGNRQDVGLGEMLANTLLDKVEQN
jgi:hypothetical protein